MVTTDGRTDTGFAGIGPVTPRPADDLAPLLDWLRTGRTPAERLDFAAGTALPDGRLDLCKQALGPDGAAAVADALRPGPVRHLLLGTDGLGDRGASTVTEKAAETGVETLYLGCNGITAGGVCRIADGLRASPQAVTGVWLKRNPLGADGGGGRAVADLIESARSLRTLDLVQTGLDATELDLLTGALTVADRQGRRIERLYVGGNPLGTEGARPLAALLTSGAVGELYVAAARLGDEGALLLADALTTAPHGRLRRLSVASNGIGPRAVAALVSAAVAAGVEVCDLGRVKAAGVLGAIGAVPRAVPTAVVDPDAPAPRPRLADDPGIAQLLASRNARLAPFWLEEQGAEPGPLAGHRALVVDAEDRFTTMLAHQLRHLGLDVRLLAWNAVTDAELDGAELLVAGPGPGDPRDSSSPRIARMGEIVWRRMEQGRPVLAVCLSHQILADGLGIDLAPLDAPHQGLQKRVPVFGEEASIGFYNTFTARVAPGTTHVGVVSGQSNGARSTSLEAEVSADPVTGDVYALRGDGFASVQGHLESILSRDGIRTLERLIAHALT